MSRRRTLVGIAVAIGVMAGGASAAAAAPSYVALGDSYASGDGTGVYFETSCFTSPDAYPPLVASADDLSLTFAACSGATTSSVISSQLGSLNASTSLVTVQVGGNDAGFTNVIVNCAALFFTCSSAIDKANSFIENTLPGELDTTYTDIRNDAPNAQVLVIGYPHLFTSDGSRCGLNVLTSGNEESLNQTADLLDSALASAAASHGFTFVDPRDAYSSHEVCQGSPWLNNVTPLALQESYHPNIAGEAGYAGLIESDL